MRGGLPERLGLRQLAAEGTLQAVIGLAQLKRLQDLPYAPAGQTGQLAVELSLATDAGGSPLLLGRLRGSLTLQCQRCLQPMAWPVELSLALHLLHSEAEAAGLPDDADYLVLEQGELRPREWLEEEIILALPLVPRHEQTDSCSPAPAGADAGPAGERQNPFSVLKKLKR